MISVLMLLGPYPFMLRTAAYTTLKRTSTYRWKQQDRLGRSPAQQYLGPDAGKVDLSGEILPHFAGGYSQVDRMRATASLGKPLLMVDGRGHVWGDWVITQIQETETELFADGAPRVISFSLSLTEYGDDRGGFGGLAVGLAAVSAVSRLL